MPAYYPPATTATTPYWGYRPEMMGVPQTVPTSYSPTFSQRPQNNLLRVTGPESAKAYPIPPNSEVALFDGENPVFYVKTTDASGYPTLRTFKFEEVAPQVIDVQPAAEVTQPDLSGYASKDDVDALRSDISEIKEALKGLV